MRMAEWEGEKRGVAESIAEEADVVKRCQNHEHMSVRGVAEPAAAYALAEVKFKSGQVDDLFSSTDELKRYIQAVIDDSGSECEACTNWAAD